MICPLTFVNANVAMDTIEKGQIMEMKMDSGSPICNVPASLEKEGHKVLKKTENSDGTYTVYFKKG